MTNPGLSRAEEDFSAEYPGSDPFASECFVNMIRVGDRLDGELSRRLRSEAKLSLRALMLLATLDGLGGEATASELGKHVPITSASITSLVDTCERNKLVKRIAHPHDRRKTPVVITHKGRELMDRLLPGVHQLETQVLGVLSHDEQETLLGLLARIQDSVTDVMSEAPTLAEAPRHRPERLNYSPTE